jgi:hypothetical protein
MGPTGLASGRGDTDAGQAAILVIGLLLVAMAATGLAVDMARAFAERAALRSRADEAAVAATSAVDDAALDGGAVRIDPEDAARRAAAVLRRSGAGDAAATTAVAADGRHVTVTVRRSVPTLFLRVVGIDRMDVGASATASASALAPGG